MVWELCREFKHIPFACLCEKGVGVGGGGRRLQLQPPDGCLPCVLALQLRSPLFCLPSSLPPPPVWRADCRLWSLEDCIRQRHPGHRLRNTRVRWWSCPVGYEGANLFSSLRLSAVDACCMESFQAADGGAVSYHRPLSVSLPIHLVFSVSSVFRRALLILLVPPFSRPSICCRYVAPEVLLPKDEHGYTTEVDLWSIGVIRYGGRRASVTGWTPGNRNWGGEREV